VKLDMSDDRDDSFSVWVFEDQSGEMMRGPTDSVEASNATCRMPYSASVSCFYRYDICFALLGA